jgi:polyhydroxyalkanoate synthesis repressor PhaR
LRKDGFDLRFIDALTHNEYYPMTPLPDDSKGLLEIRKYSNRRYYDTTQSRHLTLEEIRDRVREGYDVRVTDSKTSQDITPKILTQIILDLDSVKLELFPAKLLAQLIRTNDQLVMGFYDRFFGQALEAFLHYQRLMESQLAQGSMMPSMFPPMPAWSQAFSNPVHTSSRGDNEASRAPTETPDPTLPDKVLELERQLKELKSQVKKPAKNSRRRGVRKPRR